MTLCACFCVFSDTQNARFWSFAADRGAVLSALRYARAQAIAGVCRGDSCARAAAHGVRFDPGKSEIVIFQGADFLSRNSDFDQVVEFENRAVCVVLPQTADAIFYPPSGNADPLAITLQDNFGHRADISVDESGRVDWQ